MHKDKPWQSRGILDFISLQSSASEVQVWTHVNTRDRTDVGPQIGVQVVHRSGLRSNAKVGTRFGAQAGASLVPLSLPPVEAKSSRTILE
jgi:hypothetical protein